MQRRERHRHALHPRPHEAVDAPTESTADAISAPARSGTGRWAVGCWLFVLVAIGTVQIVRLQWFDATIFFAVAVAIASMAFHPVRVRADASRTGGPRTLPVRRAPLLLRWLAAVATLLGATLCLLPRHSVAMQIAVVAVGAGAVALAASGHAVMRPGQPTALTRGILRLALAWAIIVILGCVWELVQFILGLVHPDATWFALSDLLNPAVATVPGQVAFIAVWLAGGVWLLRRGGRR